MHSRAEPHRVWSGELVYEPGVAQSAIEDRHDDIVRSVKAQRGERMAEGRLTREDWIAAARKALVASGIDDVKVDVLARRLKVTRGSFYWHFEHRQALLDVLLKDWEASNLQEIEVMEQRAAEGTTGLSEMFRIWLGEDPAFPSFDVAIRVWARKSRPVATVVSAIDDAWVELFQSFFEASGMTAPQSFVRARIMYFHQVGYYALSISESLEERIRLAPYYYAALMGSPAPAGMEADLRRAANKKMQGRKSAPRKKPSPPQEPPRSA